MSQTAQGTLNTRQTMIAKHGSEEAWKEYMRQIASEGGKKGTGHAFAHGKVDPRTAGRKGGYTSRRGSKKNES